MTEPTVQVPVSQVAQWRNDLQALLPPGTYAILRKLDALLAQPTPSAELVFQKQVWSFMCPAPSCRLTEYGFADRQDADNALRDHLVECHD